MPTQTSLDQIQNLYIAFYGRPADPAGQTYWANELDAANGDPTAIINQFATSAEYDSQYGSLDDAALVNALYQQILGRDAEQGGLDFYLDELNAGNLTKGEMALAILNGATGGDAVVLENRMAVADQFTAAVEAGNKLYGADQIPAAKALLAGVDATTDTTAVDVAGVVDTFPAADAPVDPTLPPVIGEDFQLTSSTDILTGTENDDTFNGYIQQNEMAGGISNSLASADRLDGGAGNDSLYAELVSEFIGTTNITEIDVQPRINDIETIAFEARDFGGNLNASGTVSVDAKYIQGVDTIGSRQSDGDLVIENLTTLDSNGNARNTSDLTISMDHTDNFNSDNDASDLTVYFDEDYLNTSPVVGGSTLLVRLVNAVSNVTNDNPIFGTDSFTIMVGETEVTVDVSAIGADPSLDYTTAYDKVVDAINAAASEAGFDTVTAALQPLSPTIFSIPVTVDGIEYEVGDSAGSYYPILVTNTGPEELGQGKFMQAQVETDTDINSSMRAAPASETELPLSINIDLNKVGREGEGGNLIVGGKELDANAGADDEGLGFNVFNVDVLGDASKPSNLGTLNSTNGDLEEINIRTHADFLGGDSYASLTIRDGFGDAGTPIGGQQSTNDLKMVNANGFLGDLALGTDTAVINLDTLTATGGGNVEFNASITGAEKDNFGYTTGAGADTVVVALDGDAVDTIGTSLTINTGAENDSVAITINPTGVDDGVSQLTSSALRNLTINTGAGDDNVNLDHYANFQIETGAGNDFVRINSVVDNGNASTGAWAFGQATGPQTFGARVLYKADLTLTFAGFESKVAIETDAAGNFVADQLTINAAIENAIEQSPELSNLLRVTSGTGAQQLVVTSTVGGLNDLRVQIDQPEVVEADPSAGQVLLNSNDLSALSQGLIDTTARTSDDLETVAEVVNVMNTAGQTYGAGTFDGNVGANGVVGADYQAFAAGGSTDATTGINFSTVNAGTGSNDLVVFHSNDNSANVLEITQQFGKVSVVNFHDISPNDVTAQAEVGNHALDFTSYLNNQIDPSATANQQSAQDINITLNTNAQLAGSPVSTGVAFANSVNMLNFDGTVTDSIAWDELNATNLVAALNGSDTTTVVGGIVDATLDATNTTANLIGTEQKHIVMVENDQNKGEYKVFYLTSQDGNTDGNFDAASAELLGTLDFGNSINFGLVGNSAWETQVHNLMAQADGGELPEPGEPGEPTGPTANVIDLTEGTESIIVGDTSATDGADLVTFDLGAARGMTDNTQINLLGFDTTEDTLQLDLDVAATSTTTLADLEGTDGVVVEYNPFANATLVTFGPDANGEVISLNLAGIADASLVTVEVV